MKEFDEYIVDKELDKWNDPDEVAYRNRHGCEFEREEPRKYSFWDLRDECERITEVIPLKLNFDWKSYIKRRM